MSILFRPPELGFLYLYSSNLNSADIISVLELRWVYFRYNLANLLAFEGKCGHHSYFFHLVSNIVVQAGNYAQPCEGAIQINMDYRL